jgi:hypothetical protein
LLKKEFGIKMARSWLKLEHVQLVLDKIHQYGSVVEDWKERHQDYRDELIDPLSHRLGPIEEQLNKLFVKVEMRETASQHGNFLDTDEQFQKEDALSNCTYHASSWR